MQGFTARKFRYVLPRLERHNAWFSQLLDAYAVIDASVDETVREALGEGKTPGCRAGCAACCRQPIPLTPAEAAGLALFIGKEGGAEAVKKLLAGQAANMSGIVDCPFLDGASCLAYPVRPMACRRFLVAGEPCAEGTDPTENRAGDMLIPSRKYLEAALKITAPYYRERGVFLPERPEFRDFAGLSSLAQQIDWAGLLKNQAGPS